MMTFGGSGRPDGAPITATNRSRAATMASLIRQGRVIIEHVTRPRRGRSERWRYPHPEFVEVLQRGGYPAEIRANAAALVDALYDDRCLREMAEQYGIETEAWEEMIANGD